jgi:hypothetical protein
MHSILKGEVFSERIIIDTKMQIDAWSTFWQTAKQGAIDLQADDPVARALRTHWLEQVTWMSACNCIADVGSGPAVLPRLILDLQPALLERVKWLCIDQACVVVSDDLPDTVTLLDQLDFGAANLPDHCPVPDGLVSNFGIEYVKPAQLAEACARWLSRGGRFHAVVHATGSIIDQVSGEAGLDIGWALEDVRLLDAAQDLFAVMMTLPTDPIDRMMHGVGQRDAYNTAVNRVKQRMEDRRAVSAPLMDLLNGLRALATLALAGQAAEAQEVLKLRRVALQGELLRLQAMRDSALDDTLLEGLRRGLESVGLVLDPATSLDCVLGRVAWVVSGYRT